MKRPLALALLLFLPALGFAQYATVSAHMYKYRPVAAGLALRGNGYHYMVGDTLMFELGGVRYKQLLTGATDGQSLVWNSALSLWKPGTVAGDSAGASALNSLTNSTANGSLTLGAYYQWYNSTEPTLTTTPIWWFRTEASLHTNYLALFNTDYATSNTKVVGFFARGTTNGVEVDKYGEMSYQGTGTINANRWKGSATFDKASQHAATVYEDQLNVFTAPQLLNSTSGGLGVTNTGSGVAITGTNSSAAHAAGYFKHTGLGIGLYAWSVGGIGLSVNVTTGTPATFSYGGTRFLDITSNGIMPVSAGQVSIGSGVLPFREVHADSLFIGGVKVVETKSGKAYFDALGEITVTGLGTDSMWVAQVTLAGDPGQPITYYSILTELGELFVKSLTANVEGLPVFYSITKRTDL